MTESGIIVIDKPENMTSHDAVNRMRRVFDTRKIGHTGTLDPMATGVLPILVGNAVKASEFLMCEDKRYEARIRFGVTSDTQDAYGSVSPTGKPLPGAEAVLAATRAFVGNLMQTPPMYSAVRVDGRRLYELAREGKTVEREPRAIRVESIDVSATDILSDYILDIVCTKGTYIRTLCADIGDALGCGAVMASLRRLRSGGFSIEDAYELDYLLALREKGDEKTLASLLQPVEKLFIEYPAIKLPPFYSKLARCGCEIYSDKIGVKLEPGAMYRVCDAQGIFFLLARAEDFDGKLALKGKKMFL